MKAMELNRYQNDLRKAVTKFAQIHRDKIVLCGVDFTCSDAPPNKYTDDMDGGRHVDEVVLTLQLVGETYRDKLPVSTIDLGREDRWVQRLTQKLPQFIRVLQMRAKTVAQVDKSAAFMQREG